MHLDLRLVVEDTLPHHAVGVGPDRVVDPREIRREATPPLGQKVRQQIGKLVVGERVLQRIEQLVPDVLRSGLEKRRGHELVVRRDPRRK